MRRRRPAALPALLVLALIAVTGGCSDDPDPTPSAPSSSTTEVPLPLPVLDSTDLPEITTGTDPVWTSRPADTDGDGEVALTLLDDLAVVSTESADQVVDLTTGRVLWRSTAVRTVPVPGTPQRTGRLVSGETTAGPVTVAAFAGTRCYVRCTGQDGRGGRSGQRGVVAYDVRTGDVVWGRGLVGFGQSLYEGADRRALIGVEPVGVTTGAVVAQTDVSRRFGGPPGDRAPAYAVGLDPATGGLLWTAEAVVVQRVVGDVVLGVAGEDAATSVVALDATTGEELWRTEPTDGPVALGSASPRVLLVRDATGTRLLDTATGEPLDQQLPEGTRDCASWVGGDTDLACAWVSPDSVAEVRLLTITDGTMSLSAEPTGLPVQITEGGIVLLQRYEGPASVVDPAGREVLSFPTESVVAITDGYVAYASGTSVVDRSRGATGLAVLRRD